MSTLFTVSTYLIDRERFRYPERPIVFLAGELFLIGVGIKLQRILTTFQFLERILTERVQSKNS